MIRAERLLAPGAHIAEIILDRPEKRNALTPSMLREIRERLAEFERDDQIRAVVLRGEGRVFCAGFDLDLCRENSDALRDMLTELSLTVRALRRSPLPVIAAAHGAAIAGGCALLGGADLVVTNTQAKLGYPVVRLGISPAVTAPLLRNAVGVSAARQRMLLPSLISGEEAFRLGLATRRVDLAEDVRPRAQLEADALGKKPPAAFASTKQWLNEIEGSLDDAPFDAGSQASLALVGSPEERSLLEQMWTSSN